MTRTALLRSRVKALTTLAVARARLAKAKTTTNLLAVRKAKEQLAVIDRQLAQPVSLKAYKEAKKLLGVMEEGGNNQGAKVTEIIRANGGTGPEPWCGDFVAYCYRLAGCKWVSRSWASVYLLGLLVGLSRTNDPVIGDLVRYEFDGDDVPDHVGLFGHWCDANGKSVPKSKATHIRAVEGNTGRTGAVSDSKTGGDGVYEKVRPRTQIKDFLHVS